MHSINLVLGHLPVKAVIAYDRRDAIVGIALEPGISGITTNTTTWNNYLNAAKTTNVEQVAYQLVTIVVSQGTEVIYLRYADKVPPANGATLGISVSTGHSLNQIRSRILD